MSVSPSAVIAEADKYLAIWDYKSTYELLSPYKNSNDDQILWRLARSMYELAFKEKMTDEMKKFVAEAYHLAEKALKINDKNAYAHQTLAILIDFHFKNINFRIRLRQSENVMKHITRAIELNPADPHSHYILGFCQFSFASAPRAAKKLAETIFSCPMEGSFEDALKCFEQVLKLANANNYKQYVHNITMIGKTYAQLGDKSKAKFYLNQVFEYKIKTDIDEDAHAEAKKALKNL